MHTVFSKTFGGLSGQYYFRHLFFSLCMAVIAFFAQTRGGASITIGGLLFIVINTLLYPYARFVYESVVGFIMGDNVFYVRASIMLFVKFVTMTICWSLALVVAPIGLGYLYYHHSKNEGEQPPSQAL